MTLREYAKLMNDTALQGSLSNEEYNRLYRRHCFQRSFVCFIDLRYYKAYRQLRQKAITTPNNLSP